MQIHEVRKDLMTVTLWININGSIHLVNLHDVQEDTYEQLKNDYQSYLETGEPRGGAYKGRTSKKLRKLDTTMTLKFDDIALIK